MEKTIKYFVIMFIVIMAAMLCSFSVQTTYAEDETLTLNVKSNSVDYKNSTLYYTDKTDPADYKICSIDLNKNSSQSFSTGSNQEPELVVADFNGNIFYTQNGTACLLDKNKTEYRKFNNNGDEINKIDEISKIVDLDCSRNNHIYALSRDTNNKSYLLVKKEGEIFEIFCKLDGITLNTDCKMSVSLDESFAIMYAENNFYKITPNSCELITDYVGLDALTGDLVDMKLDYHNNLFVLTDQKLYKSNKDEIKEFTDDTFLHAKTFEIEYLSGQIFCVTNDKITTVDAQSVVEPLSTTNIVDYTTEKLNCSLIKTTKNTLLYRYDNCIYTANIPPIQTNTTLCALKKTDSDFYFVLINNINDDSNLTGFIKAEDAQVIETENANQQIRLVYDNTPLYAYPSTLDDENCLAKDSNGPILLNNNVFYTMTIENFGTKDSKNNEFSQIEYNSSTYYIKKIDYVKVEQTTINPVVDENETQNNQTNSKKLTTGEIVGIVLISITAVCGAIFVLVLILKKKKEL